MLDLIYLKMFYFHLDSKELKPFNQMKHKLINLDFDFTSLHEFLNNARWVMNQHANVLNSLRKDMINRWLINDMSTFFNMIARWYPTESVKNNMDYVVKTVFKDNKESTDPNKHIIARTASTLAPHK